MSKRFTTEEFILKLRKINPSLTVIGEYVNANKRILVKDNLNIEYYSYPVNLLRDKTPSINTATNKNDAFAKLANVIHKNKYLYNNINYIDNKHKVSITCPIHKEFYQLPSNHLKGVGCPNCSNGRGYSKSQWITYCDNKNCVTPKLYIIRCFNSIENFIKIGYY